MSSAGVPCDRGAGVAARGVPAGTRTGLVQNPSMEGVHSHRLAHGADVHSKRKL
jgi:hypothetical protein